VRTRRPASEGYVALLEPFVDTGDHLHDDGAGDCGNAGARFS
jgi:hypothetical protein